MSKTALSFYLDDTSPYGRPPETFQRFLDFVAAEGIAGESSVILGSGSKDHGLLSRPTTDLQGQYIEQLHRAHGGGIDAHMEVMTHSGLYDFAQQRVPDGAQHEGVWLHEPEVPVAAYEAYFRNIIAEGERIGVRFTGMTWPGCSCEPCTRRYRELRQSPSFGINPNVWTALLNLAREGKFRGPDGAVLYQRQPAVPADGGGWAVWRLRLRPKRSGPVRDLGKQPRARRSGLLYQRRRGVRPDRGSGAGRRALLSLLRALAGTESGDRSGVGGVHRCREARTAILGGPGRMDAAERLHGSRP